MLLIYDEPKIETTDRQKFYIYEIVDLHDPGDRFGSIKAYFCDNKFVDINYFPLDRPLPLSSVELKQIASFMEKTQRAFCYHL